MFHHDPVSRLMYKRRANTWIAPPMPRIEIEVPKEGLGTAFVDANDTKIDHLSRNTEDASRCDDADDAANKEQPHDRPTEQVAEVASSVTAAVPLEQDVKQ